MSLQQIVSDPNAWVGLLTLTILEIVLGIDNLVFISIAVSKLPPDRRPWARKFGLALACITRILLLISLAFLARMQTDLFTVFGNAISIRCPERSMRPRLVSMAESTTVASETRAPSASTTVRPSTFSRIVP